MINSLVFYNHYHNGDIVFSKEYVREIKSHFETVNFLYLSFNSSKNLKDLQINHKDLSLHPELTRNEKIFIKDDTLYINTWIGNYLVSDDINLVTYHSMFTDIYAWIYNELGVRISIRDINNYLLKTDFDYYDVPRETQFDYENTILFSNGPVNSGQSKFDNLDHIIDYLCKEFPEKNIILTHKSSVLSEKIFYTSDIIGIADSDLNEIAYISEKVKYLIGRHSGPFCFMQTKDNLNGNKVIIGLGKAGLNFTHKLDVKSKIYELEEDENLLKNIGYALGNKIKINAISTENYIGSAGSSFNNPVKNFEWVRDGSGEASIFIDSLIPQVIGSPLKNKFCWLLESRSVIPEVFEFVESNYKEILKHCIAIFTCDDNLAKLDGFAYVHSNAKPWIEDRQIYEKNKLISMISSHKSFSPGHANRMRYVEKFKNDLDFYGRDSNPISKKEEGLRDYMFSIVIENAEYDTYFTEKISDCFATGTIPVYLGTKNIGKYFNEDGIIMLDADFTIDKLSKELYYSKIDAVKENFEKVNNLLTAEDYIYENYLKGILASAY